MKMLANTVCVCFVDMNMLPSCVKFHLVQSTGEQYVENCTIPSNKGFANGLDQPIG